MIKCIGCGAPIQFVNVDKPGYVKEEVFNKTDGNNVLCERCFKIKNYNYVDQRLTDIKAYNAIISKIAMTKSLFLFVADITDLTTLNFEILSLFKNRDLILVFNKIDLLPKSMKEGKIKAHLRAYLKTNNVKYKDLILISTKKNYNIDLLVQTMEKWRKNNNVYMVGNSNVGKSSLLNSLIKAVGLYDRDVITVSNSLATTLSLIEVPFFADGKKLIDSPGVTYNSNMLAHLDYKDFKTVQAKSEIRARLYQIKEGDALIVGGLFALNILRDTNLVIYMSNQIKIIKCKSSKLEENYPAKVKEMFNLNTEISEIDKHHFEIAEGGELVISGLGFINFKKPASIDISILKDVKVVLKNEI